eukprot:scaffold270829_cov20-Tisochrysis_lutea.AAC.2
MGVGNSAESCTEVPCAELSADSRYSCIFWHHIHRAAPCPSKHPKPQQEPQGCPLPQQGAILLHCPGVVEGVVGNGLDVWKMHPTPWGRGVGWDSCARGYLKACMHMVGQLQARAIL